MADSRLDIIISLLNEAKGELKTLKKDLGDVGKASDSSDKKTVGFGQTLKGLATTAGIVAGAVVAVGIAAKKAFDFTEEGAQVIQLTESFGRLGISIESLRTAAGGTMADMDLMAATNKALAGTQGQLRAEMTAAIPALLNMARAAVKLDPTLGSVDHAFMSLVAGIKKGQPLLIDNTNAIVSVGAANERWAKANNTTVESMTASQKQMALLTETVGAGVVMLDQVGGSVASATDAWSQFRAEMKNNTNAAKAFVAEGAMPLVQSLADGMKAEREFNEAFPEFRGGVEQRAFAIAEYAKQTARAKVAQDELTASGRIIGPLMQEVAKKTFVVSDAMRDAEGNVISSAEAWEQYSKAIADVSKEADIVIESMDRVNRLKGAMGSGITESLQGAQESLGGLRDTAGELETKIAALEGKSYLTGAQKEELGNLKGELGNVRGEIAGVIEDAQKMAGTFILGALESRIEADGIWTQAETDLYAHTGRTLGLWDENAAKMISSTGKVYDAVTSGQSDAIEGANALVGAADTVAEKYTKIGTTATTALGKVEKASGAAQARLIDVGLAAMDAQSKIDAMKGKDLVFNFKFNIPDIPKRIVGDGVGGGQAQALGGVSGGGRTRVGERGPEDVYLPAGARVMNNLVTNNNYYNQTVNTRATTGTARHDFALLRAMG